MQRLYSLALALLLVGCASSGAIQGRHHAYAFDQPEVLAMQRTFGVGNAVTILGAACVDVPAAKASFETWQQSNGALLQKMTQKLAFYYRMPQDADALQLQKQVAARMYLKTTLDLDGAALTEACESLPQTLALPSMNLAARYQAVLQEVSEPDYLKPKRSVPAPKNPPSDNESPPDDSKQQSGTE